MSIGYGAYFNRGGLGTTDYIRTEEPLHSADAFGKALAVRQEFKRKNCVKLLEPDRLPKKEDLSLGES
jgi:hypothetical protein